MYLANLSSVTGRSTVASAVAALTVTRSSFHIPRSSGHVAGTDPSRSLSCIAAVGTQTYLRRSYAWKSQSAPQQSDSREKGDENTQQLHSRQQKPGFNSLTPTDNRYYNYGNGQNGSTLEVPLSSVVIIFISTLFWYLTRNHTEMENEISFKTFLANVLPHDAIDRLEVINHQFIRVVLKPEIELGSLAPKANSSANDALNHNDNESGPPFMHHSHAHPGRLDRFIRYIGESTWLGSKVRALLKPVRPYKNEVLTFEIGDVHKLESILYTFTTSIPSIYYRSEIDYVHLLRAYVPSIILAAFALSTVNKQAAANNVAHSLTHTTHQMHNGHSAHDRIIRFTKATPTLGRDVPKVTFGDVAGLEQAKKEVSEFVEFLKLPKKFIDLGAEIPKGALLVGPPGTGKTLLAKAVAGEANVPFYSMSGSDFIELFVGVGPSRIRDLFDRARKNAPAIVFIDEIDTIGRSRAAAGSPSNGGSDERESTLNALLVEMDGFTTRSGVVILGGTNRGDVLDPALTRSGRFDRRISLSKPSVRERKAIFDIHIKPIKLDSDLDSEHVTRRLAALTPGFTGAEIKSVCNEAAIVAARINAQAVTMEHLELAVERLIGGLQKTGNVLSATMKSQVALHEAGHAVAGWFLDHADPVLKLSIVPRASGSLGYTQMLPDEILLIPREELLTRICVLLAGRASEQLYADTVSTGAVDDLEKATRLAYQFVSKFGLDKELGLASFPTRVSGVLGTYSRFHSEATAQLIDQRVRSILEEQMSRCLKLLKEKRGEVKAVADMLLDRETISFADLKDLLGHPPGQIKESIRQFVEALPTRKTENAPTSSSSGTISDAI